MGSIKQNLANNILSDGKFDATDLDGTIPNTNINDNSIDNVTSFPAAGSGIPSVASDPPSPSAGDVWYNTTSNAFKYLGLTTAGAWATGGSLNTGRRQPGGAGTQTAALGFGGTNAGFPVPTFANTESYDGTSWTEVNDLNTARGYAARGSGGTQTSALYFGGAPPPGSLALTESWNGTSWTEVGDLNLARYNFAGAGADNTSMLAFGGIYNPEQVQAVTEDWNGTSWTEVADLNTGRYYLQGFGVKTSALATGGEDLSPTRYLTITEQWNGTSWTEVADLNASRVGAGAAGADNTSGLIFGGFESDAAGGNVGKTELWNGTSWSEEADLIGTVYQGQAGAGTATAALSFGGEGPANQQRTETQEWLGAGTPVTKTVTTA